MQVRGVARLSERTLSMPEMVFGRRDRSITRARDFGNELLLHAGTRERSFHHRHWPVLHGSSFSTMLQLGKRCRAQTRKRASTTGITTRNGFCRSSSLPVHKSLRCYQSPRRLAELLSALVAKGTMTFWPMQ